MEGNVQHTTSRSVGIDATRTILNLLIVLYHSGFPSMSQRASAFDCRLQGWAHTIEFVLPSLFCLSGYLLMRGYSMESFRRKLVNRLKRLAAPLYLVNWAILAFIPIALAVGLVHDPKYNLSWGISRFLCIAPGCGFTPLWYLRTLLLLTFASPLIYLGLRGRRMRIVTLSAVAVWCVLEHMFGLLESNLSWYMPGYAVSCFMLGAALSYWTDDLCVFARRYRWLFVVAWAGSIAVSVLVLGSVVARHGLVLIFQCLAWFAFADWFAKLNKSRLFQLLAECSFFIYVFHVDMQWDVMTKPVHALWNSCPDSITSIPGALAFAHSSMFLVNVFLCVMLYLVLKRVFPLCARILNGRL